MGPFFLFLFVHINVLTFHFAILPFPVDFLRPPLHWNTPVDHHSDAFKISTGFTYVEPPHLSTFVCLLRYINADSNQKTCDHVTDHRWLPSCLLVC